MAVPLFFALSGFLLWRPHAAAAWGRGTAPRAASPDYGGPVTTVPVVNGEASESK